MIRAWHCRLAQRPGAQSSLCDPERTLLSEEFGQVRGILGFGGYPVQLPLQLPDALAGVTQRSQFLQLIDDLLDLVVTHGRASFRGVCHKTLEAPTPPG